MNLDFQKISKLIQNKELTCLELMQFTLKQIDKYDTILESYISIYDKEELLEKAKESDKRRQNGKQKSLIDGLPVAIKDNMHSIGINTSCGSNILKNYKPVMDATAVTFIKESGGIVIGKTNMDEFAMGSTTETSSFKHTKNPHDLNKVPGGSSGGSAVAVASGMASLALGSDTGGSIRQPASFCGVVGIKPTYGLVSRFGLVAYASSLDQIGPLSNDVYGSALMLNIISGFDKNDSTSLEAPKKDYTKDLGKSIKGIKIAVFSELLKEGIRDEVKKEFQKTLDLLKKEGAVIEEVSFSAIHYVVSTYYFIATAEAASNLSRYDGVKYGYRSSKQATYDEMLFSTRSHGFGKEVKKRILLGNFVLSSGYYDEYYRKAQKVRRFIMDEMKKIFSKFDAVATPTTPDTAFNFGESVSDPMKIYLADITTVLANLAGVPALSVPIAKIDDMPIGIQLIGKPLNEELLFQIGSIIEKNNSISFKPDLDNLSLDKVNSKKSGGNDIQHEQHGLISNEKIKTVSDSYTNRKKFDGQRVLCSDLKKHVGKKITVYGSIHKINSLGGIEFYTLRDRSGMTQLVIEDNADAKKITPETVVKVTGLVTKEDRSPFENIEIKVENAEIYSYADSELPINISGTLDNINLPTILDNRPISIRNTKVQKVFKIQSEMIYLFSDYLRKNGFTEIKTPKIISSGTEGGSNIFELKYFDRTAFLAQSPQFYKQMMMGSGFERVFEVGPVFRAEMHNTVRHLNEYTSLDFEMGFIKDEQDIIDTHEDCVKYIIREILKKYSDDLKEFDIDVKVPDNFPRIHFLEAIDIAARNGVKDMDGDISPEGERVICDYFEKEHNSSFVYIIGYPVKKRPMYTMPDERLPGYTRSFDLLFRGLEITTGGQRIHDYEMLKKSIINFGSNPNDFKDYLQAFKFGMPPHGGLGMGLERLTMKLLNLKNVREATLFPRDRSQGYTLTGEKEAQPLKRCVLFSNRFGKMLVLQVPICFTQTAIQTIFAIAKIACRIKQKFN